MIKQGVSLKTYNSFGVVAKADLFAVAKNTEDLQLILGDKRFHSAWILGGGSNTLFCNAPKQPIIHVNIAGIQIIEENTEDVVILSLARDGFGSPGFLSDWARVNVSTTRECGLLVILGNR